MAKEHKVVDNLGGWDWLALDVDWDWLALDPARAPAEARGGVKFRPDQTSDDCILGRINGPGDSGGDVTLCHRR